jgi:hypothetical protein
MAQAHIGERRSRDSCKTTTLTAAATTEGRCQATAFERAETNAPKRQKFENDKRHFGFDSFAAPQQSLSGGTAINGWIASR